MQTLRLWFLSTAIALDRLANALTNGSCDETLSSRAYRMRLLRQPAWGWTGNAIDTGARLLFRQQDHCHKAWLYESRRWNTQCTEDTAGRVLEHHMKEA